jgi:putative tryptophan/tyrosine transport system substrate-binding protein
MERREFIGGLGAAATTWPRSAWAQVRPPVIGVFGPHSSKTFAVTLLPAFHRGLAEQGYEEGRNVSVEYLWSDGSYERLPSLMAELVRRKVDVIVAAGGGTAALTAKDANTTIPIIILAGDDPVRLGLVSSINRPGANITGVVQLVVASEGKRLELMHELVPDAKVIAFLINPIRHNAGRQVAAMQTTAEALGVRLTVIEADDDGDLPRAIATARASAGALIIGADAYFFVRHQQIVALVHTHALPTMYFFREFVAAGGLVSYGSNLVSAFHEIGVYAGKVLKGGDPAEMPMVQQSDKLELVLNAATARNLGLTVPLRLLALADEVIE